MDDYFQSVNTNEKTVFTSKTVNFQKLLVTSLTMLDEQEQEQILSQMWNATLKRTGTNLKPNVECNT